MINKDIIKTLKKDILELKSLNYKYSFSKIKWAGKYNISLMANLKDDGEYFNKSYREITFNSYNSANKFILLLNKSFNTNLKGFFE